MKILITSFLAAMLLAFTSCNGNGDQKMAREISEQISQTLKSLNDSTFSDVVITTVSNDSASDVTVTSSDITTDGKGNLYINVSMNEDRDYPDEWWVSIVAIIAVSLIFGSPIFLLFIICYFIYKSKCDRNRVIMESIKAGRTLPDRFYNIPDRKPRLQPAINYLAWGIGIGLFAFFMFRYRPAIAMLAFIPVIIGLGKLASYIIATRKAADNDNDNKDDTTIYCDNCDNAD